MMYVVYDYLVEYVDDDSGRVTGAVCVNDDSSGLNFGLWRTCRPRALRDISLLLFLSRLLNFFDTDFSSCVSSVAMTPLSLTEEF